MHQKLYIILFLKISYMFQACWAIFRENNIDTLCCVCVVNFEFSLGFIFRLRGVAYRDTSQTDLICTFYINIKTCLLNILHNNTTNRCTQVYRSYFIYTVTSTAFRPTMWPPSARYQTSVFYVPEDSHMVGRNMAEVIACINKLQCTCLHF
jgi:hypothetical protein